jgi:integrase
LSYRLFRVGTCKVWHYRFQVAGVRIQRSTRETKRPRAEMIAQKAFDAAVVRANGGQPVPTLRELIAEWLRIHQPPVRSRAHIRSVETFGRLHLYDLGELPINQVTTTDVELARNTHLETHKPASANHWLRVLKLIAMWAVKREIIPALPWKVQMLKLQKRPRAILPIDVARTWFAAIDKAARSQAVGTGVRLMFGLGLRESESATAHWEWIDWQRSTYTPGITKGREAEPVPLPRWLVEYLQPLRRDHGLIAARADGSQLPAGYARSAMRAANAVCATKGITPHRLRGTFATLLSEDGVPVQNIQAVMRHKHPMTTMGYLEKNLGTVARGADRIGERIGFERRESGEHLAPPPSGSECS